MSDITGFRRLSETAEPEVTLGVLTDWHGLISDVMHDFGGTILDHAGDSVSVVFNDPVRVEDHEQSAIRAAFELRSRFVALSTAWRALGFATDLKFGLHSGHATMGLIGPPDARRYGAVGRTIILAALCARQAKGGQILVTQRVLGAVEDIVDVEPAGAITQGLDRPVPLFNVVRLKS